MKRLAGYVSMRLGGLFLLIGLCLGASTSEVGQGLCQELTTTLASIPIDPEKRVAKFETFLQLSAGYHSRGVVWLGKAPTETVFDTGATRNAISKLALFRKRRDFGVRRIHSGPGGATGVPFG